MSDPFYRLRQLALALRAPPLSAAETARVRAALGPRAFELFQTMPPGDQRHSLNIYDGLVRENQTARPLLTAALLHDVAKRSLGVTYRAAVVALNRIAPGALERLARGNPKSWRYPFYISLHHPELGAELAARAGVEPAAVALIRAHQLPTARVQSADPRIAAWHSALHALDDLN